jgi:CheY-like chemotaxis protein
MPVPHILLVDDVDFFLAVEKGYLKQTPASIATANNGQQALESIAQKRPDLVVLDMNMPVMDGIACCRAIKADPLLRSIPVMMVVAANSDQELEPCRQAGADGVLTKPIERRAFLELGHSLLFQVDRRDRRIPFQAEVEVRKGDDVFSATAVNISEQGIYLHTRQAVGRHDRLELNFQFNGQVFAVEAHVAWLNLGFPRPNLAMPPGFGLEFRSSRMENVQRIKRLLQVLETARQTD